MSGSSVRTRHEGLWRIVFAAGKGRAIENVDIISEVVSRGVASGLRHYVTTRTDMGPLLSR